jgi:3-phosphoshikimate 1-carboxyvinyltransferase
MTRNNSSSFTRISAPKGRLIQGKVRIPPSKSETNRAYIIGALDTQPFTIYNPSLSDDSQALVSFLQAVGIDLRIEADSVTVVGHFGNSTSESVTVDLKDAGTALRFVLAFANYLNGETIITGSDRLSQRPIKPLIDCLNAAGAAITYLEKPGHLPVKVQGQHPINSTTLTVDVGLTSQVLSALLLMGPVLTEKSRIFFDNNKLVSRTYAVLTIDVLRAVGIEWEQKTSCMELTDNQFKTHEMVIGGDWTAASYWLGLASTIPAELQLMNLAQDSAQGDAEQLAIFEQWGLATDFDEAGNLNIKNERGNIVQPFSESFGLMPDLAQTFAVLAAFAPEHSRLFDLETLPYKETHRIDALVSELEALGLAVKSGSDYLSIHGGNMTVRRAVQTFGDHRMAMSFAILANYFGSIVIEAPGVVAKSYPDFWQDLQGVGYSIEMLEEDSRTEIATTLQ